MYFDVTVKLGQLDLCPRLQRLIGDRERLIISSPYRTIFEIECMLKRRQLYGGEPNIYENILNTPRANKITWV